MKLLFLRHAAAEDAGPHMRDWDRALTDEGRTQAEVVGKALQLLGIAPNFVLSSPLVRSQQTAELIAPTFGCKVELVPELQIGNATLEHLQHLLQRYRAETVILVGHQPDLAEMAGRLVNADERGLLLKKAGLIRVDVEGRVQAGRGRLVWLLTPRIMSAIHAAPTLG